LDELARVAGVGLRIDEAQIPVLQETRLFCRAFGLDPLGLIASGALLIVADHQAAPRIARALRRKRIACADIRETTPPQEGKYLITGSGRREIQPPVADEITKIFV